jgi:hypothetical protein
MANKIVAWIKPPERQVPVTTSPIRFAVGTPHGPSTNSWKLWVHGEDIYVACRDSISEFKVSLHASGVWRLGFTERAARERKDLVPEGSDRAWRKWKPSFESGMAIGFQIVVTSGGLYVSQPERNTWPSSVIFVEPSADQTLLTIMSVVVVLDTKPVSFHNVTGAVVGILPLRDGRSAQLIATYESAEGLAPLVEGAFKHAVAQRGEEAFPDHGVFYAHGVRDNGTAWIISAPYQRANGA